VGQRGLRGDQCAEPGRRRAVPALVGQARAGHRQPTDGPGPPAGPAAGRRPPHPPADPGAHAGAGPPRVPTASG
jgi:hypothetical protein